MCAAGKRMQLVVSMQCLTWLISVWGINKKERKNIENYFSVQIPYYIPVYDQSVKYSLIIIVLFLYGQNETFY